MAAYEDTAAIRNNVALTAAGWTDIGGNAGGSYALPINCNFITIINTGSAPILLATDPGNANSTVSIPVGASWALGNGSWGGGPQSGSRFRIGSPNAACSLKSTSGSFSVTLEFNL